MIASKANHSLNVLLVEDDPMVQLVHKNYLLDLLHCNLVTATNGKKAVLLTIERPFDLILMDVGLPELNGFEATALIREYEKTSQHRTFILGVTGYSDSDTLKKCIDSGMDDVLTKPTQKETLKKCLESIDSLLQKNEFKSACL